MSRKTSQYRLYPNRQQQERLQTTLDICRELYNAGLQERIESYKTTGKGTTCNSQSAQLPDIKNVREDVGQVFSQVLQDVLHRLDKTYASFFLRVKRHQKAGFPRFKGRYRYDSFTYPQAGFRLGSKLQLSKIGNIKIKLHREWKGEVKTLTIKRENGNWYACFSCITEPEPLPVLNNSVGIDVGLETFATLSNGDKMENPACIMQPRRDSAEHNARSLAVTKVHTADARRLHCSRRFTKILSISETTFSTRKPRSWFRSTA
jgi:putative transposase